jgi:polyisoprenoid-binding protein YceI
MARATDDRARRTACGGVAASRTALAKAVAACVLAGAALVQSADAPAWRITQGDVRIAVPLRPGGAFEARTSSLAGTLTLSVAQPVLLAGELSVDLATIDTGIALRNRHLRENYLEIAKGPGFDKAVLSELRLHDAKGEGFEGRSAFTATLRLHGLSRPVTGTTEIRREGTGVRVTASFPLTLTDFGIEPPQYMGVGVGNRLIVRVAFTAVPVAGAAR